MLSLIANKNKQTKVSKLELNLKYLFGIRLKEPTCQQGLQEGA